MPKHAVRLYSMVAEAAMMVLSINSPHFSDLLNSLEIEIEPHDWNGHPDSLPKNNRAIVIASAASVCSWDELARSCAEHGHFLLCNDRYVRSDGSLNDKLESAFKTWLGKEGA
ncbi:MAG: hypothetical protein AAB490_04040 [Patescibacteria group bacterium]